jgi:RHH-type transcriptional regulator, proline utilization regulon repressor / proline dehydrogenase / delta 1-pyrroline-5-carboxylate dehydrogenase
VVAARVRGHRGEHYAAVLIEGNAERIKTEARALAVRAGPIIPLYAAGTGNLAYNPDRLLEEAAISTNTAAAGGNASLMMLG